MNILVLGASSRIGRELAAAFSKNNHLLLVGRDLERLRQAKEQCESSGASCVNVLSQDVGSGWASVAAAATELVSVDLLINAASATSRLRDDQIDADNICSYVEVDILGPVRLMKHILAMQPDPLHVIFVSTVLTLIKSPNRAIYSSLKLLQESFLIGMQEHERRLSALIVRVGKVIAPDGNAGEAGKLSAAVLRAFQGKKSEMLYGASGFAMVAIFYLQPLLFLLITWLQRHARKLIS